MTSSSQGSWIPWLQFLNLAHCIWKFHPQPAEGFSVLSCRCVSALCSPMDQFVPVVWLKLQHCLPHFISPATFSAQLVSAQKYSRLLYQANSHLSFCTAAEQLSSPVKQKQWAELNWKHFWPSLALHNKCSLFMTEIGNWQSKISPKTTEDDTEIASETACKWH